MSFKIVFFDIDGTLVNDEKKVPADAEEAIRELKSRGIEPVIATGRAPYFFKPLAEQLGIESFVSLNGGYVVYKGKPIYRRIISKDYLGNLVRLAAQHNHSLVFEGEEEFFADTEEHPFIISSVNSLRVDLPGYDPDYWKKTDIFQAFLHCESHEEHLYENNLDGLRMIRWHPHALDVLPADSSKSEGIKEMLNLLGIPFSEAAAFGDGLNDKEMLASVGLGIAMGNSHKDLLPFADYVTSHVDEGGIRNGLKHAGLI